MKWLLMLMLVLMAPANAQSFSAEFDEIDGFGPVPSKAQTITTKLRTLEECLCNMGTGTEFVGRPKRKMVLGAAVTETECIYLLSETFDQAEDWYLSNKVDTWLQPANGTKFFCKIDDAFVFLTGTHIVENDMLLPAKVICDGDEECLEECLSMTRPFGQAGTFINPSSCFIQRGLSFAFTDEFVKLTGNLSDVTYVAKTSSNWEKRPFKRKTVKCNYASISIS